MDYFFAICATTVVNLFAVIFVVTVTLISVANIFNVVSTNILLRRRDLGMLQSLGMTRRGIAAMTAREYLSCGIRALCWSLPIGMLLMLGIKILLGKGYYVVGNNHVFAVILPVGQLSKFAEDVKEVYGQEVLRSAMFRMATQSELGVEGPVDDEPAILPGGIVNEPNIPDDVTTEDVPVDDA